MANRHQIKEDESKVRCLLYAFDVMNLVRWRCLVALAVVFKRIFAKRVDGQLKLPQPLPAGGGTQGRCLSQLRINVAPESVVGLVVYLPMLLLVMVAIPCADRD